jgi:integrase/recombinase XerC
MVDSFLKYLQFEKRYSSRTVLSYRTDLNQFKEFVSNTFPDHKPETADYGVIRSWVVQLVEFDLDATSVNRKIACLRSFYKFLLKQEIIQKNPMIKIKVLKTKKKLPHFIQEKDITNLLDNNSNFKQDHEGLRSQLMLELFYGTGIRLSELITLADANVNLFDQTIKVLGKRNKERVIPFSSNIVSLIEAYRQVKNSEVVLKPHGKLFVTNSGDELYPMLVYRTVRFYLRAYTSVEKKSPHVLRHSYATHLLNKGAEINAVKDLLGHSSLAATQVYTHNSMEKLKKVFEQAHPKA